MTEPESTALSADVQPKPIRVAQVVDEYRLVLNVGKRDGVTARDNFLIYGLGGEVKDPETGENLGVLELLRGRGKVEHLQDSICTIHSTMQRQVPGLKKIYHRDSARVGVLSMFGQQVQEIEEPTRSVDEPFDSPEIGDYARKI